MADTPVSLLDRLRERPADSDWRRWTELYRPLIHHWLRQRLQHPDADDVTQEVVLVVLRELPRFRHNGRSGAFRKWLRLVTVHRLREFVSARPTRPEAPGGSDWEAALQALQDDGSQLSRAWDEDHDRFVMRRLLALLEPEFEASTWQAFYQVAIEGRPAEEIAAALGLSLNAVRIAKSRVLRRLRQEAAGLLD
jgi:RNA polymerase sigma factor (sigma-70 family)